MNNAVRVNLPALKGNIDQDVLLYDLQEIITKMTIKRSLPREWNFYNYLTEYVIQFLKPRLPLTVFTYFIQFAANAKSKNSSERLYEYRKMLLDVNPSLAWFTDEDLYSHFIKYKIAPTFYKIANDVPQYKYADTCGIIHILKTVLDSFLKDLCGDAKKYKFDELIMEQVWLMTVKKFQLDTVHTFISDSPIAEKEDNVILDIDFD